MKYFMLLLLVAVSCMPPRSEPRPTDNTARSLTEKRYLLRIEYSWENPDEVVLIDHENKRWSPIKRSELPNFCKLVEKDTYWATNILNGFHIVSKQEWLDNCFNDKISTNNDTTKSDTINNF